MRTVIEYVLRPTIQRSSTRVALLCSLRTQTYFRLNSPKYVFVCRLVVLHFCKKNCVNVIHLPTKHQRALGVRFQRLPCFLGRIGIWKCCIKDYLYLLTVYSKIKMTFETSLNSNFNGRRRFEMELLFPCIYLPKDCTVQICLVFEIAMKPSRI